MGSVSTSFKPRYRCRLTLGKYYHDERDNKTLRLLGIAPEIK
jgi:hypothetical protein